MQIQFTALFFALLALVVALPTPIKRTTETTKIKTSAVKTSAAATATTAAAAATNATAAAAATGAACPAFALQDYSAFQISDGTAGGAQAQANAVFVDPFAGCDLSTVDATSLKNLQTMRLAAEAAETDQFNAQVAAASGAAATALQNGKIKNKVLKLTGEIQGLNIEAAQGSDEASAIATEQTKLTSNIALDTTASGQTSTGVA
ncbi:hypothetical protein FIBSPDRAFT_818286 [Athelia psychrophila]|uniref:Small secreted protein n=1 Tax=Athelia psychrophila TaxID=1759441 RepID=A0A166QUL9_9AGAM|nr:hypothetical protein FIBSPDRAFT_841680 [Fibularhizoctonia sp. CBS 109695]KZP27561.1 hypothetical protein FIBSPDRAFT_818286 [Fibularhizoctonia sp. CBS 109695]